MGKHKERRKWLRLQPQHISIGIGVLGQDPKASPKIALHLFKPEELMVAL